MLHSHNYVTIGGQSSIYDKQLFGCCSTYIIHLFVVHVEGIDLGCQVVDLSCGLEDCHWCWQLLTLKDLHVALCEKFRNSILSIMVLHVHVLQHQKM